MLDVAVVTLETEYKGSNLIDGLIPVWLHQEEVERRGMA